MSKITQALEKAARERLTHGQDVPTVEAAPATVSVAAPSLALGEVRSAEHVRVDPHIVTAIDTRSPIAEQYRILKTNLQSLRLRSGPKAIVITSAVQGEGKSVTAINLALTLARQEHAKVALVDADLRKSSVNRWLGLPQSPVGLSTLLEKGGPFNGALLGSLVRLQEPPLTILPAGPTPHHPAELLESSAMKRLLAELKTYFDLVLIDTPPILAVSDPRIIASQADGVLLVVRSGKTQRKAASQAQQMLEQAHAPLIGCVLTHVEYYYPGYSRYYEAYEQERGSNGTAASAAN